MSNQLMAYEFEMLVKVGSAIPEQMLKCFHRIPFKGIREYEVQALIQDSASWLEVNCTGMFYSRATQDHLTIYFQIPGDRDNFRNMLSK
jgi:hypothetical protein